MTIERLAPDAITLQTNLTGVLASIQDDPNSPDGNWLVATGNNVGTTLEVSFPTPTNTPTSGVTFQEIHAYVRKFSGTQSGVPEARIDIYEGATLVHTGTAGSVTSATGEVIAEAFDTSILSDPSGANLRARVVGIQTGGSPGTRNTVDVGAIEWDVYYLGPQDFTQEITDPAGIADQVRYPLGERFLWSTDWDQTAAFPTSDKQWVFFSPYRSGLNGYRRWRLAESDTAEEIIEYLGPYGQNTGVQTAHDQPIVRLTSNRFTLPTRRNVSSGNAFHIYLQAIEHVAGTTTIEQSGFPTTLFSDVSSGTQAFPVGSRMTDTKAIYACTGLNSGGTAETIKLKVGQHVSGTNITLGGELQSWAGSGDPDQIAVVGLNDTEFVVVAIESAGVDNELTCRRFSVASLNGTAITAEGAGWTKISTDYCYNIKAVKIDDARLLVTYSSSPTSVADLASRTVKAVIIDVTGGTVTVGTPVDVEPTSSPTAALNAFILTPVTTDNVVVGLQSGVAQQSYRSVATGATAGTTLSVTRPDQLGDIEGLYAFIAIDGHDGTLTVTPDQAGWTELDSSPFVNTGNIGVHVFYRQAGINFAEPATYTFTLSANPNGGARGTLLKTFAGAFDFVDVLPIVAESATGNSNSATVLEVIPSDTVLDDFSIAVSATGSAVTHTPPTNYTERSDATQGTMALSVATRAGSLIGEAGAFGLSGTAQWVTVHLQGKTANSGMLFYRLDVGASGTTITVTESRSVSPSLPGGFTSRGGSDQYMEPSFDEPASKFGAAWQGYFQWVELGVGSNPPEAISDLTAGPGASHGEVFLTWTAPASDMPITDYEYRSSPVGAGTWSSWQSTGSPVDGHTVTTLTPGNEYDFQVRAENENGFGAESNTDSAVVTAFVVMTRGPDALGITDEVVVVPTLGGTSHEDEIVDNVGLTDSGAADVVASSDFLGLSDSASYELTVVAAQTVTDPIGLLDATAPVSTASQTIRDALRIDDVSYDIGFRGDFGDRAKLPYHSSLDIQDVILRVLDVQLENSAAGTYFLVGQADTLVDGGGGGPTGSYSLELYKADAASLIVLLKIWTTPLGFMQFELELPPHIAASGFMDEVQASYRASTGAWYINAWDQAGELFSTSGSVAPTAIHVSGGPATVGDIAGLGARPFKGRIRYAEIGQWNAAGPPPYFSRAVINASNYAGHVVEPGLSAISNTGSINGDWILEGSSYIDGGVLDVGTFSRTITDALGVLDAVFQAGTASQASSEQIGLLDSISAVTTSVQAQTDNLGILDAAATSLSIVAVQADGVGVTDSASAALNLVVSLTDNFGLTDTATPTRSLVVTATDNLGLLDAAAPVLTLVVTLTDNLGILDSQAQAATLARTQTNSLGLLDAVFQAGSASQASSDQVGLLDSISTVVTSVRTQTDNLGLQDAATANLDIVVVQTDGVALADSAASSVVWAASYSDALGLTDSSAAVQGFAADTTDALGLADAATAVRDLVITLTDNLGILDSQAQTATLSRSNDETVGLLDAAFQAGSASQASSEQIGLSDSIISTTTSVRAQTDTLGATDAATSAQDFIAARTDALGLTDAATPAVAIVAAATDALGLLDNATKAGTHSQTQTENLGLLDNSAGATAYQRSDDDGLGLSDSAAQSGSATQTNAESIDLSDSVESITTSVRDLADAIAPADDISTVLATDRTDDLAITDSHDVVVDLVASATDALGLADAIVAAVDWVAVVDDSVGITDTANQTAALTADVVDPLGLVDAIADVDSAFRDALELLGISDLLEAVATSDRAEDDDLGLTDSHAVVFDLAADNSDDLGLSDTADVVFDLANEITDDLGALDSTAQAADHFITITDGAEIQDDLANAGELDAAAGDAAFILDSIEVTAETFVDVADAAGLTDDIESVQVFAADAGDLLDISDNIESVQVFAADNADVLGLLDSIVQELSAQQDDADVVGLTDEIEWTGAYEPTFTDNLGLLDDSATSSSVPGTNSDFVGLSDSLVIAADAERDAQSVLGITDDTSTAVSIEVSVTDALFVLDTYQDLEANDQTLVDQIGLTDTVTLTATGERPAGDTVGLTDTAEARTDAERSKTDDLGVTDEATAVLDLSEDRGEVLDITDEISVVVSLVAEATDNLGILDQTLVLADASQEQADALGITDDVTAAATSPNEFIDVLGLDDEMSYEYVDGSIDHASGATDNLGLTDVLGSEAVSTKVVADSAGLTDSTAGTSEAARFHDDSLGLLDSIDQQASTSAATTDALGLSDSATADTGLALSTTDSLGLADQATAARNINYTVLDNLGILDVQVSTADIARLVEDDLNISDVLATGAILSVEQVDAIGFTDAIAFSRNAVAVITDVVALVDDLAKSGDLSRILTDPLVILDVLDWLADNSVPISDALGLTDSVATEAGSGLSLTDALGITDNVPSVSVFVQRIINALLKTAFKERLINTGIAERRINTSIQERRTTATAEDGLAVKE